MFQSLIGSKRNFNRLASGTTDVGMQFQSLIGSKRNFNAPEEAEQADQDADSRFNP